MKSQLLHHFTLAWATALITLPVAAVENKGAPHQTTLTAAVHRVDQPQHDENSDQHHLQQFQECFRNLQGAVLEMDNTILTYNPSLSSATIDWVKD